MYILFLNSVLDTLPFYKILLGQWDRKHWWRGSLPKWKMDSPSSPMIDVSGNMEIPAAPGLNSPSSTTIPGVGSSTTQAASAIAGSFLARKWVICISVFVVF